MEFLANYGLFALKAFTLVIAILILMAGIFAIGRKSRPKIEIAHLNKEHEETMASMKKTLKIADSKEKSKGKHKKKSKKELKLAEKDKPVLFVLDFHGDIKASQVNELRQEINAVLAIATPKDKIILRLESPGGAVNGYGLAASELKRIRDKNIPLTVCIDKVAASGGYLMACVANNIIAAPFAIVGSIGVIAQIPNFHRWLKNKDIDVELLTAGEYKRTLTMFGENTEKAREKFQEEIDVIHGRFRDYVLANRKEIEIKKIATGEHWLAIDAIDLKLVDELRTSDEYIQEHFNTHKCYKISIPQKQSVMNKILKPAMSFFTEYSSKLLKAKLN